MNIIWIVPSDKRDKLSRNINSNLALVVLVAVRATFRRLLEVIRITIFSLTYHDHRSKMARFVSTPPSPPQSPIQYHRTTSCCAAACCAHSTQDEAPTRIPSHDGRRCRRGRCRWIIAWHRHQGESGKYYFYVSSCVTDHVSSRPPNSPTHLDWTQFFLSSQCSHGDYPETWHTSRRSRRLPHHRA